MARWTVGGWAALAWAASISNPSAQQTNPQQMQIIRDTAASICDTVKEARGRKSEVHIQGDVKAELRGLAGKLFAVGGATGGTFTEEEFEGLSQDATAAAMQGDRDCRERVFHKMFDRLTSAPPRSQLDSVQDRDAIVARQNKIRVRIHELEENISITARELERARSEAERKLTTYDSVTRDIAELNRRWDRASRAGDTRALTQLERTIEEAHRFRDQNVVTTADEDRIYGLETKIRRLQATLGDEWRRLSDLKVPSQTSR
jgi:hypothetical protein